MKYLKSHLLFAILAALFLSGITFGANVVVFGGKVTGAGELGGTGGNNSVYFEGGVLAPGNPFGVVYFGGGSGFDLYSAATSDFTIGGPGQYIGNQTMGGREIVDG